MTRCQTKRPQQRSLKDKQIAKSMTKLGWSPYPKYRYVSIGIDTKISKPASERLTAFDECLFRHISANSDSNIVKIAQLFGWLWTIYSSSLHAAAE